MASRARAGTLRSQRLLPDFPNFINTNRAVLFNDKVQTGANLFDRRLQTRSSLRCGRDISEFVISAVTEALIEVSGVRNSWVTESDNAIFRCLFRGGFLDAAMVPCFSRPLPTDACL